MSTAMGVVNPVLERPVIITGTPRSGKTCVWRIFEDSTEFDGPDQEPIMIWDAGITGRDDCRDASMVTEAVRRRILDGLEKAGSPDRRYFDNLSYHALRIGFVSSVIPDVRVVHVVRDPVSCVPEMLHGWTAKARLMPALDRRRSGVDLRAAPRLAWRFLSNYIRSRIQGVRRSWGPVVPGLLGLAEARGAAVAAAFQWRSMVEIARRDLAKLPSHQVLEVRYEKLIAEPDREARRLAEFVEASEVDRMASFASGYLDPSKERNDEIRREPTEAEWSEILAIVSGLRRELGYEDPTPVPPSTR